mgnify:CR=1 FL=1|tara:strand:+ start:707 stop:958 length:252 start_codon:yes stop_codon:yes gene_type:complete
MECKPMPVNDQHDLDEYETQLQLRLEKMAENSRIKKTILKEVGSMTIHDFQNAVDKFGISGNTVVDEMVEDLVDYLFKQKIGD